MKFIVNLPMWRSSGLVFIDKNPAVMKKYVLKNLYLDLQQDLSDAAGFAWTPEEDPNHWIIWLANGRDIPELTHEAFHITSNVLRHRGVVLSNDSEEAFAYTLTSIVDQILAGIRKGHK